MPSVCVLWACAWVAGPAGSVPPPLPPPTCPSPTARPVASAASRASSGAGADSESEHRELPSPSAGMAATALVWSSLWPALAAPVATGMRRASPGVATPPQPGEGDNTAAGEFNEQRGEAPSAPGGGSQPRPGRGSPFVCQWVVLVAMATSGGQWHLSGTMAL